MIESAVATLKSLGAIVVDPLPLPTYVLEGKQGIYRAVSQGDFKAQIGTICPR